MAWRTLIDIIAEARDIDRQEATEAPVDCPNDHTALKEGPNGTLFCSWDGWQYPRDA